MTGPSDTIPVPPPGVDVETVEAFCDDVQIIAMTLETAAFSLAGLAAGLRKQAAEARAK